MQNISFLVILSVLLSCAFFFSDQTHVVEEPTHAAPTAVPTVETREDLPDCAGLMDDNRIFDCYEEAATLSQRLVENLSDQILSQQVDSAGRMAFLEMQQAWEISRDADCSFIGDQATSETQGAIDLDKCLIDRNLARLDQLVDYFCADDAASCAAFTQSEP